MQTTVLMCRKQRASQRHLFPELILISSFLSASFGLIHLVLLSVGTYSSDPIGVSHGVLYARADLKEEAVSPQAFSHTATSLSLALSK